MPYEPLRMVCPECGASYFLNEVNTHGMSRESRVQMLQNLKREHGKPFFLCIQCRSDGKTVGMHIE